MENWGKSTPASPPGVCSPKAGPWTRHSGGRRIIITMMSKASRHAETEPAPWTLSSDVAAIAGVGKRRSRLFAKLGIRTISDLLRHFPMRYEYESAEGTIDELAVDWIGQVRGKVVASRWVAGKRKGRFEVTLADETGRLNVLWFNAGYLRQKIHPSQMLRVQGKVKMRGGYPQMVNPRWELIDEEDDQPPGEGDRYRPIYPATEDLPSRVIEQTISQVFEAALSQVVDPLPRKLLDHHAMPDLAQAIRHAHFPANPDQAKQARRRLAYNELLLLQLGIAMKRAYVRQRQVAPALRHSQAIHQHICQRFPFELTAAQAQVIEQIAHDLTRTKPMNRLLQGDVGAGKTVVALYALLMAVANRKQGALMAPTELLAEQHFSSISRMLAGSNVRLGLLTGGHTTSGSAKRKDILNSIAAGDYDIVVGTHALITDAVQFHDLAVAVIDEQHRFGVMQRAGFRIGASQSEMDQHGRRRVPHHLVMTATPIPRTLSLTVFGDLDVSTIRGLPPGRSPVVNRVVGQEKVDQVYAYLGQRVADGQQAYVVVPTIDDTGQETSRQLKNVKDHAKLLQQKLGESVRVEAMHGRLKRETREQIMTGFRAGKTQVLVATTVIEVGVDVPHATIMVIEHAERFGLAQLHQLRGRIGRGNHGTQSLCVFVAEPTTTEGAQRLEAIAGTNDGFKVAEMDLEIRGMGEFFGTRQHGLVPLRVAEIPADMDLLQLARRDAQEMIHNDPLLADESHGRLRRLMLQQYGQAMGLIDVG